MTSSLVELDLRSDVHRRYNPLTGEWVLVSPHRTARPWQGQTEVSVKPTAVPYDPACYLCPGNTRAGGLVNPSYAATFVFDNDFAALRPQSVVADLNVQGLLQARGEEGRCRVICYSPLHGMTLGDMPTGGILQVIDTWAAEYSSLGANPRINAVTIFENRGATMGASNPHPHGQIWANETVPGEMLKESGGQRTYLQQRGSCLLCDYAAMEIKLGERVVHISEHFVAVVPFWAVWPFETLVLPRFHVASLEELSPGGRQDLAGMLKSVATSYDSLFDITFPYTMGMHQQPTDGQVHPQWHLHMHFYPPLLRSAGVRKFMVGYEMLAGPQRDITPEVAAQRLRGAGG